MTNTEIRLNPIEERLFDHWEDWLEWNKEDLDDEDIERLQTEFELLYYIVPLDHPLCDWAFWTDGTEFYTKSKELAERLWKIINVFADAHMCYYDPEMYEGALVGNWSIYWD